MNEWRLPLSRGGIHVARLEPYNLKARGVPNKVTPVAIDLAKRVSHGRALWTIVLDQIQPHKHCPTKLNLTGGFQTLSGPVTG